MPTLNAEQEAHYGDSKQSTIIATSVVFLVLCNASVIIRVFSQFRVSKRLFLDDYAIVLAAICSDLTGALYLNSTKHGLGLHIYRVLVEDRNPPHDLITLFKSLYINAVVTGPCFAAVKISLLWFYRRTFLVNQKWLYVAWWINLIYVILWTIGSTLFYVLQCIPPDYYWNRLYRAFKIPPPSPVHGQCDSATADLVAIPLILSLVSDFGILLLPTVTLARLHMRLRRKIGLTMIFSLGLLACACEIARIWLEFRSSPGGDATYDDVSFVIFTFAEGNIAITAACAPLLASQWNRTMDKVRSSLHSRSSFSTVSVRHLASKALHSARDRSFTTIDSNLTRSHRPSQSSLHREWQEIEGRIDVQRDIDLEMRPRHPLEKDG